MNIFTHHNDASQNSIIISIGILTFLVILSLLAFQFIFLSLIKVYWLYLILVVVGFWKCLLGFAGNITIGQTFW